MKKSIGKDGQGSKGIQVISPSLPKGGGSVQGMGETFAPNEFNGSASITIPIPASPCRGFEPSLSLNYSSGNGNSPFGMGWELSTPEITRRTSKEMPTYTDDDTFLYTADGYLVPVLGSEGNRKTNSETIAGIAYDVDCFQPRSQGAYDKIERYRNPTDESDTFWKITSADNVVSIFGKSSTAKVYDPNDPVHIFKWLLEEVYDDKGNHQVHTYIKENNSNIPSSVSEINRDHQTQAYPAAVHYGNNDPITDGSVILKQSASSLSEIDWHFEIVFDYGVYDISSSNGTPHTPPLDATWPCRQDPFSDYSNGFEVRTYRLCKNVLLFHRFEEIDTHSVLTSVLQLSYEDSPILTQLTGAIHTGYQYLKSSQTYNTKSLPKLSFSYTPFAPAVANYQPHGFQTFENENDKSLQQATDAPFYQLIDLYGEGIPGILYNDGTSLNYQEPLAVTDSKIKYAYPKAISFPIDKIGGTHVLTDVTGNGRLDLMVSTPQHAGYYQLNDEHGWQNFETFESFPGNYLYPGNSMLDVTGDGVADVVLIEEDNVRYHASLREKGFAPSQQRQITGSLPSSKPNAPNELLLFTDMIGSGLSQRVRITRNSIECWPNLGYGKFGEKVMMDHAPDFGPDFNTTRLLWADIDGSGTTDLVYLHTTHIDIYLNQSGNSFSQTPISIPLPASWDPLCKIQFADVKGNGTNCLVFAKTHPVPEQWYYDFNMVDSTASPETTSQKPWLLNGMDNNMGATSSMRYASSTKFYLEDKANGRPWITHLPFPVNVIESVTHYDEISNTQTTSSYRYSHGYYDGFERIFRGFGRVDRTDASSFANFKAGNEATAAYEAPPAFTRTWYHTGAFIEQEGLVTQYKKEFWNGDPGALALPNTLFEFLTDTPVSDTLRDAHRTLHGAILRTEVYGNDASPWQDIPYTVSETQFHVIERQAKGVNKYSVFQHLERQSISYDYERNAADPRIAHEFMLVHDYFGHVLESCAVNYPRRSSQIPADMDAQTQAQQEMLWVSLQKENFFASLSAYHYWDQTIPTGQTASNGYLIGLEQESKSHQVNGLQPGSNSYFTFEDITTQIATAVMVLLHWERAYYYDTVNQKELPLGTIVAPALHHRSEMVEFDIKKLEADFSFLDAAILGVLMTQGVSNAQAAKGGHVTFDSKTDPKAALYYWNPGSAQSYHSTDNFCLPKAYYDPFQYSFIYWGAKSSKGAVQTTYQYDHYNLFASQVVDPLGNTTTVIDFDYRTLHPATIEDLNKNTSSVMVDALGMVIATSEQGKQAGESVGFADLSSFTPLTKVEMETILSDPATYWASQSGILQVASFFYYDLHSWKNSQVPAHGVHIIRDNYTAIGKDVPATSGKIIISYSDGFGRPVQEKAWYDGKSEWLTTGVVRYNDKGHPIQQYEPYFATQYNYKLHQKGYSDTLFYDALGRKVLERSSQQTADGTPEGFFTKTLFGYLNTETSAPDTFSGYLNQKLYSNLGSPVKEAQQYLVFVPGAWSTLVYDENDCILDSDYQPQPGANIDQDAITKATAFANTPHIHIEDSLGHVVQSEQLNVANENERNANYFTFDILGDELTSADQRLHPQGLNNFEHTYNLSKESISVVSADAGTKWSLTDVAGHPIYSNDSRGTQQFHIYDVLLRPICTYVQNSELEIGQIVQSIIYGDSQQSDGTSYFQSPSTLNLRGKPVIGFDQAGLTLTPSFDIHGLTLLQAQWLKQDYKNEADWSSIDSTMLASIATAIDGQYQRAQFEDLTLPTDVLQLLESAVYIGTTEFDAVGRVLKSTDADQNTQTPAYYSTNWIKGLTTTGGSLVQAANADAPAPGFPDVQYDARGQRQEISFANGTKTYYTYDPFTFELTGIKSTRKAGTGVVETIQHLQYHHDPVGNVTSVDNLCVPTVFFNNQMVEAKASYIYNALYQLTQATGREHAGMWQNDQTNQNKFNDTFFQQNWPQLSNGKALQNYTQTYQYDAGGNLTQLKHNGLKASTRTNVIQPASNRILSSAFGSTGTPNTYAYDDNGNMLTLDGCAGITWNYRDNMQSAVVVKRTADSNDAEYYVYNAAGDRMRKVHEQKTAGGTTIKEVIYLGGIEIRKTYTISSAGVKSAPTKEWHCARLEDGSTAFCTWRYWVAGNVGAEEKRVQLRYQYSDSLNSSILELDESAGIITYEEYFPYGGTSIAAAKNQTEIKSKHYHYSAKEKDGITGLYYYGMRYYAPWLGRWTSTDPADTIDGFNLYCFVKGNPITHEDIGGMVATCKKPKPPTHHQMHPDNERIGREVIAELGGPNDFSENQLQDLANQHLTITGLTPHQINSHNSHVKNAVDAILDSNDYNKYDHEWHAAWRNQDEHMSTVTFGKMLQGMASNVSQISAHRNKVYYIAQIVSTFRSATVSTGNSTLMHSTNYIKALFHKSAVGHGMWDRRRRHAVIQEGLNTSERGSKRVFAALLKASTFTINSIASPFYGGSSVLSHVTTQERTVARDGRIKLKKLNDHLRGKGLKRAVVRTPKKVVASKRRVNIRENDDQVSEDDNE